MQKIVIDKNKKLNPGDVIELEFRTTSGLWVPSAQVAMIEWSLSGRSDWEIISNSLPIDNRITFTVLIKDSKPQDPELQTASIGVTALMISAAICAVGLVVVFTLIEVRQLVESVEKSPAGQVAMTGIGAAGIALLVFIIYKYILGK